MLDRQKHPNLHRPGGGVGGSNQQLQQQPGGPGGPNAAGGPGGMGKKSNSTSQLSAAGKAWLSQGTDRGKFNGDWSYSLD